MQPRNKEINKLVAIMYKDRGMMKWAPFDALNGFHETIEAYKYKRGKQARPTLLEDKLNQLDIKLKEALEQSFEIQIYYYFDGYINHLYGRVRKVDLNFRYIILDHGSKIALDDIVDIVHLPQE